MAPFNIRFNVHREMQQPMHLKSLTNITQNEQGLHFNRSAIRTNWSADIMQESKVAGPHVSHIRISVDSPAVKFLLVKDVLGLIESPNVGLRLDPNLAIFADAAKAVGLRIDNVYLRAEWYHSRVLDKKGCRVGLWMDRDDETSTKLICVKPELNRLDTHVRSRGNHRIEDV